LKLGIYVLKRLILLIPLLIGIFTIIFCISHVIPGDPTLILAGKISTPEIRAEIRQRYGLDKPLYIQYYISLTKFLHGDLGKSIRTKRPVIVDIIDFFPASIEVIVVGIIISVIISIPLGVISSTRKDSPIDHLVRLFALGGTAMPNYWLALSLQILFSYGLHLLPLTGRIDVFLAPKHVTGLYMLDSLLTGNWPALKSALSHIIMPAFVLSLSPLAVLMRMTRSSMLDVMGQDYVRTAKAYGFSNRITVYKYALKNAIIPTITHIGMSFAYMFGGTVIVETVFDWPGIGLYITDSILYLDFPAIIGGVIISSLIVIFSNLAVDIIYAFVDPRIRY